MIPRGLVGLLLLLPACAGTPKVDPAFPLTEDAALADLARMRADPRPLARPLVVVGGFFDPGFASRGLARRLGDLVDDGRILPVSVGLVDEFDTARTRVIEAVDAAFPGGGPVFTTDVDVVAFSMGGLVARDAAAPPAADAATRRRLRIARLFTISTPHRGAAMADWPAITDTQADMRAGSDFLARLDRAALVRDYPVFAWVRTGDGVVGTENASGPFARAWWVTPPPLSPAHSRAWDDDRILADVARRLRGEAPFSRPPGD